MKHSSIIELESKISKEIEDKHFEKFSKQAQYLGTGVYGIPATNLHSTSTRELFLMFCCVQENIKFNNY